VLGIAGLLLAGSAVGGRDRDLDPANPESWEVAEPDLYAVTSRGELAWAVGYWGTVLRSTDAGASWSRARTPTTRTLFAVSFADDRNGFAVGEEGIVLRSGDGGRTWTRQAVRVPGESGAPVDLTLNLFGVEALSPREAWAVGDLGVVLRTRDGRRWEQVLLPEDSFSDDETPERIFNAIHFHDPAHGWIVGEFGTVLRTLDGGETWSGQRSFTDVPSDLYLFDVASLDASRLATVGLAGIVLVSGDGGATWAAHPTGLGAALYGISWGNPRGIAVGDRGEIVATSDQGASWRLARRPPLFDWLSGVTDTNRLAYAVGERGVILRSDDAGASWTSVRGARPAPVLPAGATVPAP
jgi:photosystem II stability/assembly factor-like uncharacterized protein